MKKFSPFHMLTVVLLITGTTVGAGMLGLPIKTGLAGLLPSLLGMIIVWGLMLGTAWILASRIIESDHSRLSQRRFLDTRQFDSTSFGKTSLDNNLFHIGHRHNHVRFRLGT